MPRCGAHFYCEQLVRVLSHYDVGVILGIRNVGLLHSGYFD